MKPITFNVSEPVYREFQAYAKRQDRPTSALIREAMAAYIETRLEPSVSVRRLSALDLGEVYAPLSSEDNLLEELLDDPRT